MKRILQIDNDVQYLTCISFFNVFQHDSIIDDVGQWLLGD